MSEKNQDVKVEYSTPKFVEYGSAVDLTKGNMVSGLLEGTEPWTGYRRPRN
jgi:hypothetical protein